MRFISLVALVVLLLSSAAGQPYKEPLQELWNVSLGDVRTISKLDLELDGRQELCVSLMRDGREELYILDERGKTLVWHPIPQFSAQAEEILEPLLPTDLEGDGFLDLVAIAKIRGAATLDKVYWVRRSLEAWGYRLELKWSHFMKGEGRDVAVCDVDGDKVQEALVASHDFNLYITDLKYRRYESVSFDCGLWEVECQDIDSDGIVEVLVGKCNGTVVLKRGVVILEKHTAEPVVCLAAMGDSLLYAAGAEFGLVSLGGEVLWEKRARAKVVECRAVDVDADNVMEAVILLPHELLIYSKEGELLSSFSFPEVLRTASFDRASNVLYVGTARRLLAYGPNEPFVINKRAESMLEEARRLKGEGKLEEALRLSNASRKLFLEVGNEEGVRVCEALMIEILTGEALARSVEELYSQALSAYEKRSFGEAIAHAESCLKLAILIGSDEWAFHCHDLLSAARAAMARERRYEALSLVEKALAAYSAKEFQDSSKLLEEAAGIFGLINDSAGLQRCSELQKKVRAAKQAFSALEEAKGCFNAFNFSCALELAKNCSLSLRELGFERDAKVAEELAQRSEKALNATSLLEEAEQLLSKGDFAASRNKAELAMRLYQEAEHEAGVGVATSLLEEIKAKESERMLLYAVAFLAALVLLTAALYLRLKKPKPPQAHRGHHR